MLTFQFIPWEEVNELDSDKKVQKLLRIVKQDKIVVMEGQLATNEEAILIEETMTLINSKFKGVEIGIIGPQSNKETELIITGRDAHPQIIEMADLVTEMKLIKHYYEKGVSARRGIEY